MILAQQNPKHHGFTSSLTVNGSLRSLKFQVCFPSDWVYIGRNISNIRKIVTDYEKEQILPGGQVRFW